MDGLDAQRLTTELVDGVMCDGSDGYFYNTDDDPAQALRALDAIGAVRTAAIVRRAFARFPGGSPIGAKRTVPVEILGLPVAAHVESARRNDVQAGRELLHEALPRQPRVSDVLADRGYRGLVKAAEQHGARLVIKGPPRGQMGFVPIAPLYKVEHAFAQLGRWRRLSRCFEGTAASARAWLEVACLGYLFSRL